MQHKDDRHHPDCTGWHGESTAELTPCLACNTEGADRPGPAPWETNMAIVFKTDEDDHCINCGSVDWKCECHTIFIVRDFRDNILGCFRTEELCREWIDKNPGNYSIDEFPVILRDHSLVK